MIIKRISRAVTEFANKVNNINKKIIERAELKHYLNNGRKPWSQGYDQSKFNFISRMIHDEQIMTKFRNCDLLGNKFGYAYDERAVEYPWTLSRLPEGHGKLLDAGSVFNFRDILEYERFKEKDVTIFTLAPESHAFWERGISYVYGDLRQMPFRDNYFDAIGSLSTLGHVGMDNRIYTKGSSSGKIGLEAQKAVQELIRILKPGGIFLGSVVFGKHMFIEWDGAPFAEQFDSKLLADLMKNFSVCKQVSVHFYKYDTNGWNVCSEEDCKECVYFNVHTTRTFDPDMAAAARAVALIEAIK